MLFKALGFNSFRNIFKRPVSTFTFATKEEKFDVVQKYKTKELIEFLRGKKELDLIQEDLNILEKERFNGKDLLKSTQEDL